mgnify:FL=1|tara:strand:- start:240 stop:677 length:438 start_codon:yes stop_codon:yes gene_type:complete
MDAKDGSYLCRINTERHTCNLLYLTRKETMKKLLLLLLLASPAAAQQVTPNFTQGSMQSTTTTTVEIDRTIATEIYGGAYSSWSGTNVTPSGDISNSSTTFSVHTAGDQFQLEIVTRAAGVIETIDIDETIEQVSTTTSLSVFSQ